MKKMQRRGKLDKETGKKGKDKSGGNGGESSGKGGGGKGGGIGKENFDGTESIASHDDGYSDDELVFDPMDDVATSDETSETGGSVQPPPQVTPVPMVPEALDLRGMPMHPGMPSHHGGGHPSSSMHLPHLHHGHLGNHPHAVPPGVESLHSANPIDKLYLMQDSYFTQM